MDLSNTISTNSSISGSGDLEKSIAFQGTSKTIGNSFSKETKNTAYKLNQYIYGAENVGFDPTNVANCLDIDPVLLNELVRRMDALVWGTTVQLAYGNDCTKQTCVDPKTRAECSSRVKSNCTQGMGASCVWDDNNGCTSTPTPCMNGSKPEYVNCNSYFEIKEGNKNTCTRPMNPASNFCASSPKIQDPFQLKNKGYYINRPDQIIDKRWNFYRYPTTRVNRTNHSKYLLQRKGDYVQVVILVVIG